MLSAVLRDDTPLPDDAPSLQKIVRNQRSLIAALESQIAALKRARFGCSSEKIRQQIDQLELMLDEISEEMRPAPEPAISSSKDKAKPVRQKLPEELPRIDHVHEPENVCPDCGDDRYSSPGEEITEVLDYVPAHFKVIRHIRPKRSCKGCERIRIAGLPTMPITKGKASSGLLAQIILSKYCDHLPLYRQSEIYARENIHLPRSTMAGWMGQINHLIEPLYDALKKDVLASNKLHADDTTVPVLEPGLGRTKTGRLWVYVRDDADYQGDTKPAAFYCYSQDRKSKHPQDHLKDFERVLQADGYAGYNAIMAKDAVINAACWAHARRKFYEEHQNTKSPESEHILQEIGRLYEIERTIKGKPPDERAKIRQNQAIPILETLKINLEKTRGQISGKSPLAVAIRYALSRWDALLEYTKNGHIQIDNNAAERAMRPVALGRKNYLFAGSDKGGHTAAAFYSLIETAKRNNLNPHAYLSDLLNRIAEHPINKIEDLLPQNWKPQIC